MSDPDQNSKDLPFVPIQDSSEFVVAQQRRGITHSMAGTGGMTFGGSADVSHLRALPAILLQAAVLELGPKTNDGHLVFAITAPFHEILAELERDPDFLHKIPWDKHEQLIAGAYHRRGFEVILTPRGRKGDKGRDVIATLNGLKIRIVEQVKAYKPGHLVKAQEVDSLLGVLHKQHNVSKGIVTTTSDFAPGIAQDAEIRSFMPHRLELRNGTQLSEWLRQSKDNYAV